MKNKKIYVAIFFLQYCKSYGNFILCFHNIHNLQEWVFVSFFELDMLKVTCKVRK